MPYQPTPEELEILRLGPLMWKAHCDAHDQVARRYGYDRHYKHGYPTSLFDYPPIQEEVLACRREILLAAGIEAFNAEAIEKANDLRFRIERFNQEEASRQTMAERVERDREYYRNRAARSHLMSLGIYSKKQPLSEQLAKHIDPLPDAWRHHSTIERLALDFARQDHNRCFYINPLTHRPEAGNKAEG